MAGIGAAGRILRSRPPVRCGAPARGHDSSGSRPASLATSATPLMRSSQEVSWTAPGGGDVPNVPSNGGLRGAACSGHSGEIVSTRRRVPGTHRSRCDELWITRRTTSPRETARRASQEYLDTRHDSSTTRRNAFPEKQAGQPLPRMVSSATVGKHAVTSCASPSAPGCHRVG